MTRTIKTGGSASNQGGFGMPGSGPAGGMTRTWKTGTQGGTAGETVTRTIKTGGTGAFPG
jgi:hypothetical protein